MPPLPPDLQNEAGARWQAVREAFLRDGLSFALAELHHAPLEQALVFSDFIFHQVMRRPAMLAELLADGNLQSNAGAPEIQHRVMRDWQARFNQALPGASDSPAAFEGPPKEAVMQLLREIRQQEMVRIALRDICGWADLTQTMAALSDLADASIGAAVSYLSAREAAAWGRPLDAKGNPVGLVVLGLGKLGAHELNFSSDVDLIFAYAADGQTSGGPQGTTANETFFTRLCRELIHIIGTPTADGFVFRVDTRLRPYGDAGPLVMIFDRMEDYYQEQGREWERYALIKARVIAGDHSAGNLLLSRLRPFVFRRYLDYGAFDSLREMKGRIALEIRGKGMQNDIKLGSGGIREIEFFGQMFQLIRGGVESALQIRPIRQVLQVLVKKRYIPETVGHAMDQAYVFLRTVENRLQQWSDQQTHHLPPDARAQRRLAAAMGFADWPAFLTCLDDHRRRVHTHFSDLLAPLKENGAPAQDEILKQLQALWHGVGDQEQQAAIVRRAGYQVPGEVLRQVAALREDRALHAMSSVGRERINRLVPLVLQAVGGDPQADLVLSRIFDMIRSIQQRTSYIALLLENPSILTHLVQLAGASPWIASFLGLHPVLLDELLDPRSLYRPPRRKEIEEELAQRLAGVDAEDLEYQMEVLRVFKQVNVLRVAASDITHVLPLMKVSDHLSDIAEVVLEAAVNLCFQQLKDKYGAPACSLVQGGCERGFVVIAYGKLGGLELGYGSDLDLVFLHAAQPGNTSGGTRSMDNAQFFSRLGQRVLHLLTTHTGAGVLYDVDMRLRPSGDSGMLVSHVDGYSDYQRNEAWTWEHQALIRARAVIGDPALQARFEAIRQETLTRKRDAERLRREVADMRARLHSGQKASDSTQFDIKQGAGGILDIEFLVQYLALRHAHRHPAIVRWTDNVRLLQALNEAGILDNPTAYRLRRAYLIYRAMVHRLNLAQQSARVSNDRFEQPRRFVIDVWNRFLGSGKAGKPSIG